MCQYCIIHPFTLMLLLSVVAGCGQSIPSESDAMKALHAELQEHGQAVDFKKTNGQEMSLFGVKGYVVFVQGATTLPAGYYAIQGFGGLQDVRRTRAGFLERDTPLPEGTIYAFEGEVLFRSTEKGWIYDSWNRKRFGYCSGADAKNARHCYKALGWEP